MGLLDTLLGRTKPVKPNLDALFALPSAAVTLETSGGFVSTGRAGVAFKPPAGQAFHEVEADLDQLLRSDTDPVGRARHTEDSYGYHWVVIEASQIDDLVTRAHMVHSTLQEQGFGPQLLCAVFGFEASPSPPQGETPAVGPDLNPTTDAAADDPERAASSASRIYLVYLTKRGTFYPFAPTGKERRDTELELRIRSLMEGDLPVEKDLARWFPLWGLPV
jgi:hypothetical protein